MSPGRRVVPPVVAVVGPTAAGKSDLAVELALRLGGEVVNADSMQVYRGMDIGTAKLTPDERRGVPHHLLDIWPVTHAADVVSYRDAARAVIAWLQEAGRVPILVGGSGLYVRAVLDDLDFPGTDPELRARLEADLAERGAPAMHELLRLRDPAAAAAILPGNGRRIVRALEVVELTGSFRAELPDAGYAQTVSAPGGVVQLGVDRDDLDARIDIRCRAMWDAGFVAEVQTLERAGLREGRTASRALGYKQVLAQLDAQMLAQLDAPPAARPPETPDALRAFDALAETVRATRRFVRRQRSWFRRDARITWLAPTGKQVDEAEGLIAAAMHR